MARCTRTMIGYFCSGYAAPCRITAPASGSLAAVRMNFGTRHARPGAGTGGAERGLAFRIREAGYRLAIPRPFAALFLLSLTGIVICLLLDWLSRRVLRHWHESAGEAEEE